MPFGSAFVVCPGTHAAIHGGCPSRESDDDPERSNGRPGPPKHVQPLPPLAAFICIAAVACAPTAS